MSFISKEIYRGQNKKERWLGLKIDIYFSLKSVIPNPCKILGFYLLIYIEHKKTIEFWSNELTKIREKIESWVHN